MSKKIVIAVDATQRSLDALALGKLLARPKRSTPTIAARDRGPRRSPTLEPGTQTIRVSPLSADHPAASIRLRVVDRADRWK